MRSSSPVELASVDGTSDTMSAMSDHAADHRGTDRRRDRQGGLSRSSPPRPRRSPRPRSACEAAGAAMIHLHVRDGEHRPTLDLALLQRVGRGGPRVQRPDRPALHRRQRPRPARPAAQGARRRARLVQPDDGHHELRRRRLLQPLAVRLRALPARPGARRRPRVRAVRPRPGARAAPAARPVRPARRRQGPRRPGDGRARRHERYDGRARRRGARPAGRDDQLVGHRHRPLDPRA